MDALLLALLLTLALDQGTGTQALIARWGDSGEAGANRIAGLTLGVAANAALAAAMGGLIAALLIAEARLLFLAIALMFAAIGQFAAAFRRRPPATVRPNHPTGRILLLIVLRRAGENGAFAVSGVAAFTGAPILAAIGAMLGGWAALVPPLALGSGYVHSGVLRAFQPLCGLFLLCASIWCAAGALRLI